MLKQLRNKKIMKRILWTIAILIIPAFVFWGAGSVSSKQKGADRAGTIFGRKVSLEEYSAAWQAVKIQSLLIYGAKFDEVYEALNLDKQAWDRLILLSEAKKRKVRVSDQEVVAIIQQFPFLQSKGQFDKRAYGMLLEQVFKTTARQFEEDIRGSLVIEKLRDMVIKDVKLTDEELKEAYRKENEKSRIAYILISPNEFKDKVAVDPAAIEAHYKNNAESFKVPDQVNIEYLGFEYQDYQGGLEISDKHVEDYYNKHKDEFDPKKELKDLKETIKNELTRTAAKDKALQAAEKIDYALADKTKTIEDAARENSLIVKETGFFSSQGPIPQIGWFPEIQKIAFKLKAGERSDLIKSNMDFVNGYYVIRLKEKRPSYLPTLEEVRDRIVSKVKDEETLKLARQEADKLRAQILDLLKPGGIKFEEAAINLKREPKQAEPFARNGYIPAIGSASEIGEAAFNSKQGEVSQATKTQAGFCIFTMLEVIPVNEKNFKKDKKEFLKKTLESKKMSVLNDWYADLMKRADCSISKGALSPS